MPKHKSPSKIKVVGQPLTGREHEVLWLIAEGLSNKEIANRLAISAHTVKFHVQNASIKIGASSRTRVAVDFVLSQGRTALVRISPASAKSECATRRAQLLKEASQKGNEAAEKSDWIGGFAVALAEVHRHSGSRAIVCEAARKTGLTRAMAHGAGISAFDLEELERAGIP